MNPILMKKVRVFRPSECKIFINAIPKRKYQLMFKALLYSGMRYIEIQRFKKHPEWFDGNFVHLPEFAQKKKKRKQLERWVRLNSVGKEVVRGFLDIDKSLPKYSAWRENLQNWAEKANLSIDGLGPKTTRKTWESWLVFYYEGSLVKILNSQGHTKTTSIEHYINLPFTDDDKRDMKEFVEGWI